MLLLKSRSNLSLVLDEKIGSNIFLVYESKTREMLLLFSFFSKTRERLLLIVLRQHERDVATNWYSEEAEDGRLHADR
jgi:hypothetical protein